MGDRRRFLGLADLDDGIWKDRLRVVNEHLAEFAELCLLLLYFFRIFFLPGQFFGSTFLGKCPVELFPFLRPLVTAKGSFE